MSSTPTKTAIIGTFINGRNSTNDFLQLAADNGANVFCWIDAEGVLWGFELPPSGVTPGSYTSADITVNEQGIITAASSGSPSGTISYATSFTNETTVTITGATHGLGTADLITAVYDSSTGTRNLIIPNSVSVDTSTYDVTITFGSSQSGRIVLIG